VKRISLNHQVAFFSHVYFKGGSACELAGNWLKNWLVHSSDIYWDCKGWEVMHNKLPCKSF
jgi:hypothetical protein